MGLLWGCPLLLIATASLPGGCSGSPGHSLRFLCTVIWDPDRGEPDFVAVVYLDDQLGGRYNSTTRKAVSQGLWGREVEEKEPHVLDWYTRETRISEQRMKNYLMSQTHLHNLSRGLYIWQRTVSCEIAKDGRKRGFNQHAYNGEDYLSFDKETLTWTAGILPAQVTKRKWDAKREDIRAVRTFLEEECIWWLEKFLNYGKESLLRREPPVVTVRRKAEYDGLETLVCRAHGFHPKEIDATWRKDGEVWEQEAFRGGVIPNSDGTYHTWLSIMIHPKDRDRYRCHVEHDGLPEPLDLGWEEPVLSNVGLIVWILVVVVGILVVATLLLTGIFFYFRRRRRDYQAAHRGPPME